MLVWLRRWKTLFGVQDLSTFADQHTVIFEMGKPNSDTFWQERNPNPNESTLNTHKVAFWETYDLTSAYHTARLAPWPFPTYHSSCYACEQRTSVIRQFPVMVTCEIRARLSPCSDSLMKHTGLCPSSPLTVGAQGQPRSTGAGAGSQRCLCGHSAARRHVLSLPQMFYGYFSPMNYSTSEKTIKNT